jgi:hypothetical protein
MPSIIGNDTTAKLSGRSKNFAFKVFFAASDEILESVAMLGEEEKKGPFEFFCYSEFLSLFSNKRSVRIYKKYKFSLVDAFEIKIKISVIVNKSAILNFRFF